jgi:hypothetical protein
METTIFGQSHLIRRRRPGVACPSYRVRDCKRLLVLLQRVGRFHAFIDLEVVIECKPNKALLLERGPRGKHRHVGDEVNDNPAGCGAGKDVDVEGLAGEVLLLVELLEEAVLALEKGSWKRSFL